MERWRILIDEGKHEQGIGIIWAITIFEDVFPEILCTEKEDENDSNHTE